jgi:hypothetical protein
MGRRIAGDAGGATGMFKIIRTMALNDEGDREV